ncbi:MAG: hypothetical protein KGZ83_04420 [Sulfuricella sp.]|nr:hypothetical protein [Sulfuricella sp.]
MWMHGPYVGGFSFFMIFPAIFLLIFLLFVVFRVGRRGVHGGCAGMPGRHMRRAHSSNARDLLDQRYARGEIDDAQYLKMKESLAS